MATLGPSLWGLQRRLTGNLVPKFPSVQTLGEPDFPFKTAYIGGGVSGDSGTFIANGATPVVVSAPGITANSTILFGLKTVGGTPAAIFETARTPGVGFTVNSVALNTSTYNWRIIN